MTILAKMILDTKEQMYEAMSHLAAALAQSLDSDDQVIMQHIRDAYVLLGGRLEWLSSQSEKTASESTLTCLRDNTKDEQS